MNLGAPTQIVFIIATVIAIIALLMVFNAMAFVPLAAFWVMTIAFVILAAGCLFRGA